MAQPSIISTLEEEQRKKEAALAASIPGMQNVKAPTGELTLDSIGAMGPEPMIPQGPTQRRGGGTLGFNTPSSELYEGSFETSPSGRTLFQPQMDIQEVTERGPSGRMQTSTTETPVPIGQETPATQGGPLDLSNNPLQPRDFTKPTIPTGQAGSPQANFAARMKSGDALTPAEIEQANALAANMGTTFDPATGYDRQPFIDSQGNSAPTGVEATQARIGQLFGLDGPATLNQAMTGQPNAVMGTDAQGRMRSFETPEARTQNLQAGQASFEQASAEREQRLAERDLRPGESQAQRDTRLAAGQTISDRGDGLSMAEATRMAGGDRREARAMIERQRQGYDPISGKKVMESAEGELTFDQQLALRKQNFAEGKFDYELEQDIYAEKQKAGTQKEADVAAYKTVTEQATRLGELAEEATGLSMKTGTTGIGGALLKHLPGTNANQLKEVLAVVQSDVALSRLADLKATGATLGQISNVELEMLQNSFDALKQNLSGERLRSALMNYTERLGIIENKIQSAFEKKYGPIETGSDQQGSSAPADVDYGDEYEVF